MQPEKPMTSAEVAQSSDSAPALDSALVRRLWRPVERPGVIDPGPVRAILARHQRMVPGLPLAELVSRHTGSASDLAGTTVPIVYALPTQPPPVPDSRPGGAQVTVQVAVSSPIVSARPLRSVTGPAQSVVGPASSGAASVPSAVAVAREAAEPLVVQRKLATPPAPGLSPTPGSPSAVRNTGDHDALLSSSSTPESAERLRTALVSNSTTAEPPLGLHTSELGSRSLGPSDAGSPDAATVSVSLPQPVADSARSTPSVAESLVVQSNVAVPLGLGSPSALSPFDVPASSLDVVVPVVGRPAFLDSRLLDRLPLDSPRTLPAVVVNTVVVNTGRSDASRPGLAADSASPRVAARPAPWPGGERSAVPLVHPQSGGGESGSRGPGGWESGSPEWGRPSRTAAVAAQRPHSRPAEPLLLVDPAVATARPARERPGATEQREAAAGRLPVAGRAPGVSQDAGAPRRADRPAQPPVQARRQATAPIDVEHIVDAVHRRFVRRLAIEAERRAVR